MFLNLADAIRIMIEVIDSRNILSHIETYFNTLKHTGYVKDSMNYRFLLYLFLYDFVETFYPLLGDEEYKLIDRLLIRLFSDGGCMLPYSNSGADVHTKSMWYKGPVINRITEDEDPEKRLTEDTYQRIV